MKRGAWILIGFALIWVVANLPASLVRYVLDETQVTLVAPQGTLWNGSATLATNLGLTASCTWQTSIWQPGLTLRLRHAESDLRARAQFGLGQAKVTLSGSVDALSLQPLLQRYDLFLTGGFELAESYWTVQPNGPQLDQPGTIQWSGGNVRYILANKLYTAQMPPLDAHISSLQPEQLQAAVVPAGQRHETAPPGAPNSSLLVLRLMPGGSVYIGVSRGLLRLANFPWQGNEADSQLIFEVERSL